MMRINPLDCCSCCSCKKVSVAILNVITIIPQMFLSNQGRGKPYIFFLTEMVAGFVIGIHRVFCRWCTLYYDNVLGVCLRLEMINDLLHINIMSKANTLSKTNIIDSNVYHHNFIRMVSFYHFIICSLKTKSVMTFKCIFFSRDVTGVT